ncbi:MAG: F420-dependent methylene-tetrahydromethanopterin reductase [Rhodospirillaceae bacterium]|nr:F420-dependent methylene-tetrahydromethanopterin reductase [Rhodospirillaceae bacterium]
MTSGRKLKISIENSEFQRGGLEDMLLLAQGADDLDVDIVWVGEGWGQDAVTMLAYLAAQTTKIKLGTGIMQVGTRTPAMVAMTAMSLNELSDGRFVLGLGASGPQVMEGMHGVSFRKPLTRLRETVEICRSAFSGEKLHYKGDIYCVPLPGGEGKSLKLAHNPTNIPIYLATLAPKSLIYTGGAADGWLGTSFSPEYPHAHFDYLNKGAVSVGRSLSDMDLCVSVRIELGDNVEEMIARRKPAAAFTLGGMGSAKTNFYNDAFKRAGFEEDALAVQALWLAGDKKGAVARVPDEMITAFQALGTQEMVSARLQKYLDVGVTTIKLGLDATSPGRPRLAMLENIVDLISNLD